MSGGRVGAALLAEEFDDARAQAAFGSRGVEP
jgi:hypothetical protein